MLKFLLKTAKILGATVLVLVLGLIFELFIDRNPSFITWAASYVPSSLMVEGGINVCTESGSSNTYTITCGSGAKALQTYQNGAVYYFLATHNNTGAATANINTIGSKNITKLGGNATALASADIVNGQSVALMYDGTQMEMISPTGNSGSGTVTTTGSPSNGQITKFSGSATVTTATATDLDNTLIGTGGGSSNAYTVTMSPASTSLTNNCVSFKSTFANTGAATVNVDGLGVKNITKNGATATALAANDIKNAQIVTLCYDGTQYEMMSPLGNAAGGSVTSVSGTAPINVANGTTTPAITYTGLNSTGDFWYMGYGPFIPVFSTSANGMTTAAGTGSANAANTVEYQQVYFPGGVVNSIVYEVSTAFTSGSGYWMWGLYNSSGNVVLSTGQLGMTSGTKCSTVFADAAQAYQVTSSTTHCTVGANSANAASVGIGTNIPAGYYWQFSTADNTTVQFRAFATFLLTGSTDIIHVGGTSWGKLSSGSVSAIPTAFTGATIPPTQVAAGENIVLVKLLN